ncbi:MAG: acylphosphatase [Candidatus Aenigmarchaeota archaeon]|nr:acylphosphatase [Candidatus Aenigmarchaeota archaeon]
MKVRAHVIVSGIVQGIGFRASIRNEASMTGVKGYVKNVHGGKVEAVFEGEQTNVLNMIEFCRHGMPGASVDDVEVKMEEYTGEFGSFEIRY